MKKTKITLAILSIITIAVVSAFLLNSTGLVRASGVCVESATRKCLPQPAIINNLIRLIQGQDFNAGIRIGPADPSSPSGSSTQPIPKYTGIDTPWIINPNGPFEITDDSITHGLVDLRMGTTNEKPNGPIPTFDITDDSGWPNSSGTAIVGPWSQEGAPPATGGDFRIKFTGTSTSVITYQISDFIFSKSGSFPINWIKKLEVWQGSWSGPIKRIATATPSDGNLLAAHADSSPLFTISTSPTVNYPFTLKVYLKSTSELAPTLPIKEPMDLKFKLERILTKNSSGTSDTPAKTNSLPLEMRLISLAGLNDLIVESTNIITTSAVLGLAATDQPMSFSAVIKNTGINLSSASNVSAKLCINKNNDASECDIPQFSTHTGTISSNGTTTVNFANVWTPGTADIGMHSYSICDDMGPGGSSVYEANENNNCAKGIFSVVQPFVYTKLSPDNPAGGSAARGSINNSVLRLWLTAGQSSSVTISNIKIKRAGIGASGVSKIKIYDATSSNIFGESSSFVSNKATINFGTPLVIPAGTSVILNIKANISSTAPSGSAFYVSVEFNSDVGVYTSTGISTGVFPINGNSFTIQ